MPRAHLPPGLSRGGGRAHVRAEAADQALAGGDVGSGAGVDLVAGKRGGGGFVVLLGAVAVAQVEAAVVQEEVPEGGYHGGDIAGAQLKRVSEK